SIVSHLVTCHISSSKRFNRYIRCEYFVFVVECLPSGEMVIIRSRPNEVEETGSSQTTSRILLKSKVCVTKLAFGNDLNEMFKWKYWA
ncbi:unnamed protein product, partial [Brassica rapa]